MGLKKVLSRNIPVSICQPSHSYSFAWICTWSVFLIKVDIQGDSSIIRCWYEACYRKHVYRFVYTIFIDLFSENKAVYESLPELPHFAEPIIPIPIKAKITGQVFQLFYLKSIGIDSYYGKPHTLKILSMTTSYIYNHRKI